MYQSRSMQVVLLLLVAVLWLILGLRAISLKPRPQFYPLSHPPAYELHYQARPQAP